MGDSGTHGAARAADWRRLEAAFSQAFDHSAAVQALASGKDARGRRLLRLGEGEHFAVDALSPALVIKRRTAKPPYRQGEPGSQAWLDALTKLRREGAPFGPPYAVVSEGDSMALVTLRYDGPLTKAAPHWAGWREELLATIGRLGLELGDVVQGATWQGVPFVYDLSDLRVRAP